MGLALRFSFIEPIGLNYRFLTHAHSHVAMLGWVYLMLYVFIFQYFVPKKEILFKRLFWVTEFAVIGMMLSFPFQGYAAVSITFSTLHIFCSYYFTYTVWKHQQVENLATRRLLKAALIFMMISTVGVWCLGPAVGLLGQASAFYQIAIQFFLHFQFNGWFLIAVLALLFHFLKIEYSELFNRFFILLVASTVLTFALPVQWFAPHPVLFYVNVVGVSLQFVALYLLLKLIKTKLKEVLLSQSNMCIILLYFSFLCFVLKTILQGVSIIPEFSEVVFMHRNFIIGFIHLVMLGVVTGFLFFFLVLKNTFQSSVLLKLGMYSFLIGFVLTEILLLIQGIRFYIGLGMVLNYYMNLFLFSILLPCGILFNLISIINKKNKRMKPLKRHEALQPLSREHHHALLLSWKIRTGFKKNVEPERIHTYAFWFYKTHLIPHFELEETHVFTILEQDDVLIQKALNDHKTVRNLFENGDIDSDTLIIIAETLEHHIRFEERILFPEIQEKATENQWVEIEKIHQSQAFEDNLTDEFWR